MSITLNVQVDDPRVEKLLSILGNEFTGSPEEKIDLLERATRWIRATLPIHYDVARATVSLGLSQIGESVVEQADTELLLRRA